MDDKDLITEIKKTLAKIAETNANHPWRLILGKEVLSASDVIQRLDKDRKLRKMVLTHYMGLACEIEQKARRKLESNSGSPQV